MPIPILLKEYNNLEEVNLCHILFIPKNSSITLKSVISRFESKPVLIITEHEDYGKFGSHINFVLTGNTVKFEANPEAIKKAGINISSEFLKLAAIVK